MNCLFSFIESKINQIGSTTFSLFDKYTIDFSDVVGFEFGDKKYGFCAIQFKIIFKNQQEKIIEYKTNDYNVLATTQMKNDFTSTEIESDDCYDNYNEVVLKHLIHEILCPILEKVKNKSSSNNHIEFTSDIGDVLFNVILTKNGELFIEANNFSKHQNKMLDKQIIVKPTNYNSILLSRDEYKD